MYFSEPIQKAANIYVPQISSDPGEHSVIMALDDLFTARLFTVNEQDVLPVWKET